MYVCMYVYIYIYLYIYLCIYIYIYIHTCVCVYMYMCVYIYIYIYIYIFPAPHPVSERTRVSLQSKPGGLLCVVGALLVKRWELYFLHAERVGASLSSKLFVYPFSQFGEMDTSLPSPQTQPKTAPKCNSEGGRTCKLLWEL